MGTPPNTVATQHHRNAADSTNRTKPVDILISQRVFDSRGTSPRGIIIRGANFSIGAQVSRSGGVSQGRFRIRCVQSVSTRFSQVCSGEQRAVTGHGRVIMTGLHRPSRAKRREHALGTRTPSSCCCCERRGNEPAERDASSRELVRRDAIAEP